MSWRVAESLDKLLAQIDEAAPNRSKISDGSIGDTAHSNRTSDHNPHCGPGVVTARDFTHDPDNGADMHEIADALRESEDRRIKYCLVPGTRVLGTDLRWRPIEALQPGDGLLAFDEFGPRGSGGVKPHAGSRLRSATVQASERIKRPCYELVTDRGTVVSSSDHLWLQARAYKGSYRQWQRTDLLQVGDAIQYFADPWDVESSFEAGWLAGLFDGEGCLSRASDKSAGWGLQVSQRPGPTLDHAQELLSRLKFAATAHPNGSVVGLHIRGGLPEILRLLGSIPTQRLYRKVIAEAIWEGHAIASQWPRATIYDIRPLGEQEVIALQSSTRTLIAEGFFSHNCIWDERMFSSYATSSHAAWTWRPYTGINLHTRHMHVSVQCDGSKDSTDPWDIGGKDWLAMATEKELRKIVREEVRKEGDRQRKLLAVGKKQKGYDPDEINLKEIKKGGK